MLVRAAPSLAAGRVLRDLPRWRPPLEAAVRDDRVYVRDATWHNTAGSAGQFHWPKPDNVLLSACSSQIVLMINPIDDDRDFGEDPSEVDWSVRCHRPACALRYLAWDTGVARAVLAAERGDCGVCGKTDVRRIDSCPGFPAELGGPHQLVSR